MNNNLSMTYCYYFLFMSIIFGISSLSIFSIWVMLEINTLMFLMVLFMEESLLLKVSLMKYFLIQSVASGGFLWAFMVWVVSGGYEPQFVFYLFIMLKMGVPPFHNWVLSMASMCSWGSLYLLLSLQKLIPLYLLFHSMSSGMNWVIAALGVTAAFFMINESLVKRMMTLSSMMNLGWILLSLSNMKLFLIFILFYFLGTYLIFFIFHLTLNTSAMTTRSPMNSVATLVLGLLFLSLVGVPPMVGFWVKSSVLLEVVATGFLMLFLYFLVMSVFSLKAYLMIMETYFFYKPQSLSLTLGKSSFYFIFLFLIFIFSPLVMLM